LSSSLLVCKTLAPGPETYQFQPKENSTKAIQTFEEAFHSLELRQQKAQLQTILKAAHIYNGGKIGLEFR
jgi:hypothetical protein